LTAFYWMPAADIVHHIAATPAAHDPLRFLSLLAPNVLGTTGEGYAGILAWLLAILGITQSNRRERWFFAMVALLVSWPLGIAALAALGLCAVARGVVGSRTFRIAAGCVAFALLTVWFARAEYVDETFAWEQALIAFGTLALFVLFANERRLFPAVVAAVLTFGELTLVAQQANPHLPHFDNERTARMQAEVPDVMAAYARTPQAFAARRFAVQAEIPDVIPRLRRIHDLRSEAIVHDIPPSILEQSPQLAKSHDSAARDVRLRVLNRREREIDVAAASGWSVLLTHDVDWPGWRAYWNGHRLPVVTVDGAFAGAFVPPERGTLTMRYWPPVFLDGLRVSIVSLLLFVVALIVMWRMGNRAVTSTGDSGR
jgi:hypothetical protein